MKKEILKKIDEEILITREGMKDKSYTEVVIATTYTAGLIKAKQIIKSIDDDKGTNVLTIGDKIRESNEKLAEFIECRLSDRCEICTKDWFECSGDGCRDGILRYFNRPAESEE